MFTVAVNLLHLKERSIKLGVTHMNGVSILHSNIQINSVAKYITSNIFSTFLGGECIYYT